MMESQLPITKIDPSGDLTLLLEDEDSSGIIVKTFLVSAKAMSLASPVWRTMLDPEGPWRKQHSGNLRMMDDEPDALLTLLDIAHLNFEEVPATLSFEKLVHLSVLCDKYDTITLVRPWVVTWIRDLQQVRPVCDPGFEEWLFVAWVFGEKNIYEQVSKDLVLSIRTDGKGGYLTKQGKPMSENMPPGAKDAIVEARGRAIKDMLQLCHGLVELYAAAGEKKLNNYCRGYEPSGSYFEGISKAPEYARECDALVLGSLIQGLHSVRLWPVPLDPSCIERELARLGEDLLALPCHQKLDRGKPSSSHAKCLFTLSFRDHVQGILNRTESGVLESHHEHLAEQRRKLHTGSTRNINTKSN